MKRHLFIRTAAALLALLMLCGWSQTPEPSAPSAEGTLATEPVEETVMDWQNNHTTTVSYPMTDASMANRQLAVELYQQLQQNPLIDFTYGGKQFSEDMDAWTQEMTETADGCVVTYAHKETGLCVCLTYYLYADASVVEWKVRLKNTGAENSLLIQNFRSLTLDAETKGNTKLMYSKGGNASTTDFEPMYLNMKNGESANLFCKGGRSSSGTMPFFNLYTAKDKGYIGAIGWSGQWTIHASKEDGVVSIEAGMSDSSFYLLPDEEVMQPSMLLLPWTGEAQDAHNDLRHYIIQHHTPLQEDGNYPVGPVCYGTWGGEDADSQMAQIKALNNLQIGYEILWIDAGWHGDGSRISQNTFDSVWVENTGTWDTIEALYPNGMVEVSDFAHENGMGLLLWFEPERAFEGTALVTEHPEWFLSSKYNTNNFIFNLGNEEARQWLCDYIAGLINTYGVDIYRQDFNIEPLGYWQEADETDRLGVTEMKYIEGLYLFWEGLLERCPGLIIDNCASGGRRLDFESLSRSVALFRSDYVCDAVAATPEANQMQIYGLNYWLPISGTSSMGRTDTYNFRSTYGFSMQTPNILAKSKDQRLLNEEFLMVRNYFYGDYYPLTECTSDQTGWFIYQMNRADLGSGFVCAFRRLKDDNAYMSVRLSGLEAGATYTVTVWDTQQTITLSAEELMTTGLTIQIDRKMDSQMIFYEKVDS